MKRALDRADGLLGSMLLLAVAGCTPASSSPVTTPTASAAGTTSPDTIIAGTALPAGYRIDTARSLILGGGETWTGRLSYTASGNADEVFDFLRREMPHFGWVEINAVRSDINLLTFASEATNRIATIQVDRGTVLGSTRVDMIVSPSRLTPPPPPPAASPPATKPRPPARPPRQPIS